MLAKKNDYYYQIFEQEDGTVFMNGGWKFDYKALTSQMYCDRYPSLKALKDEGWELLPLDWYNLSDGDWVQLMQKKCRVLSASGYGKNRVYALSGEGGYGTWVIRTAEELKKRGWTIIQPEPQEVEELTVNEAEQALKELGREVKIKKG